METLNKTANPPSLSHLMNVLEGIEESIKAPELEQAQTRSQALYTDTRRYVRGNVLENPNETIPFSVVSRLITMLTSETIESCHPLRRTLSTITALLTQTLYYTPHPQNEYLQYESYDNPLSQLMEMVASIPSNEIHTCFETKCTLVAMYSMNPKKESWKETKRHLWEKIFEETPDTAYLEIFKIRQAFIQTIELPAFQDCNTQYSMMAFDKNPEYAYCLADILACIIEDPDISDEIKQKAFIWKSSSQTPFSVTSYLVSKLMKYFSIQRPEEAKKPFNVNLCGLACVLTSWKARYRTTEALTAFAQDPKSPYLELSIACLTSVMQHEYRGEVYSLAMNAYENASSSEIKTKWKTHLAHRKKLIRLEAFYEIALSGYDTLSTHVVEDGSSKRYHQIAQSRESIIQLYEEKVAFFEKI